jgi:hypothetical protein
MSNPATGTRSAVERKTTIASVVTYAACVGLLGLLNATTTANLIAGLPDVVEAFVIPLVPALVSFLTGYMVSHKPGAMSASARRALGVGSGVTRLDG